MSRRSLTSALACLVAISGACRSLDRTGSAEVHPEVMESVRARGSADVLIALVPPPGYAEGAPDQATRDAIGRAQDEVLAQLDSTDFRLRRRFAAVPALSGTVLSERGVRILSEHPRVVRVDLDAGGGGGVRPERPRPETSP